MFEDTIKNFEEEVKKHIKEKFGLTDQEANSTGIVLKDYFEEFLSGNGLKENFETVKNWFSNNADHLKDRQLFDKITDLDLVEELKQRAGLSEETAQKIKDFSIAEVTNNLKNEFTNSEGKLDLPKIIEKLNLQSLEESSKDLFNKLKNKL